MQPTKKRRLSPDCLPIEILQEVFFRCLPEGPNNGDYPIFWRKATLTHSKNAPLLLCSVCRWWRDVALSSPDLWTTMSVVVRLNVAVPSPNLVSVWLSRSGTLPLNLALHQQNESPGNCIAAGRILDIFERYTSQWSDVRFELFGARYNRSLVENGRASPLLRRFQLDIPHETSGEEEVDLFRIFEDVPRLQILHLSRIPDLNLFGYSSIPVPWEQLVHLTLEYVPAVGTALHILKMCSQLEGCRMKIDTVRGSLLHLPLHLPRLNKFSINLGVEMFPCFLDQLVLPNLIDLAIHVRGPLERYGWAQERFNEFLIRSNCHVRRLEIRDTGMSNLEFTASIQHPNLQALTDLVIDDTRDWTWDPFVTSAALNLLTTPKFRNRNLADNAMVHGIHTVDTDVLIKGSTQQKPCILSFLERLIIRGNCLLSPDGTFADMVESRWKHHKQDTARLKVVEIELPTSHAEDLRRLKELQGEGLEVTLIQQQ